MLKEFYCDFHIHIGRSEDGQPVKITAARNLTFANIIKECSQRKGIQMIGIVDCGSPRVINDIKNLLVGGALVPLANGGYRYLDQVTVLLGVEVETREKAGQAHCLCFFPTLDFLEEFSSFLSQHMTNVNLSSQQCGLSMQQVLEVTDDLGGILIPAHAFTPHKSVFGRCADSLKEIFSEVGLQKVKAIELGLSSDSHYADFIGELANLTFLTNSDAHSLPKIGREYNILALKEPSFAEFLLALERKEGRKVAKNFGLDPKLGKYHRTFCEVCGNITSGEPPVEVCTVCGEKRRVTMGVLDRINMIKTNGSAIHPKHRPPYVYQVPLQFLPKVGPKTIDKLIKAFGSEMKILHEVPLQAIKEVAGLAISEAIGKARSGELRVEAGGGGVYGRVKGDV